MLNSKDLNTDKWSINVTFSEVKMKHIDPGYRVGIMQKDDKFSHINEVGDEHIYSGVFNEVRNANSQQEVTQLFCQRGWLMPNTTKSGK